MPTEATESQMTLEDLTQAFKSHGELPSQRMIPDPVSVSEPAREWLARFHRGESWADSYVRILKGKGALPASGRFSVAEFRILSSVMQKVAYERNLAAFPVSIREERWSGVNVFVVEPVAGVPPTNRHCLLINPPGNATILPVNMPLEALAVANLLKVRVVVVRYRHAPEHPYPAAAEDVMTVFRHSLDDGSVRPQHIGVYGTSSGALTTAQFAVIAARQGVPQPAALAILSPSDPLVVGDTYHTNADLDMTKDYLKYVDLPDKGSCNTAASPIQSDLQGLPPTLLVSGTRDHLLSTTVLLHRALRRAGVAADLHVFEAMPHAHWYFGSLPESAELFELLGRFFATQLKFPFPCN